MALGETNTILKWDERIGIRNENGKIIYRPKFYAIGTAWEPERNFSPTMVMLDNRHFFYLPINISVAPPKLINELVSSLQKLLNNNVSFVPDSPREGRHMTEKEIRAQKRENRQQEKHTTARTQETDDLSTSGNYRTRKTTGTNTEGGVVKKPDDKEVLLKE